MSHSPQGQPALPLVGAALFQANRRDEVPSSRLQGIESLRGFACLWVLLHHIWLYNVGLSSVLTFSSKNFLVKILALFLSQGFAGVHLFLVLSGFCLYYPLARKKTNSLVVLDFFKRRMLRILPVYYFVLFVEICVSLLLGNKIESIPYGDGFNYISDIVMHVVMLHNMRLDSMFSINGSMWSLALESDLYVLFPLFVFGMKRLSIGYLLLLVFSISVLFHLIAGGYANHFFSSDALTVNRKMFVFYSVFGRVFEFFLGMVAARLITRWHIQMRPLGIALLVGLSFAALIMGHYDQFMILIDQIWGVVFALLICVCAGLNSKNQSVRVLSFLGMISYSVYLVHQPIVFFLAKIQWPIIYYAPCTLGMVMGIGYLVFKAVEQPLMMRRAKTA